MPCTRSRTNSRGFAASFLVPKFRTQPGGQTDVPVVYIRSCFLPSCIAKVGFVTKPASCSAKARSRLW